MGDAGAPAPVEEAQSAVDAVAVKAPEGCTTTGTVPTKPFQTVPQLTREELEAQCDVLRETIRARNVRIEELNSSMKECRSQYEGGRMMTEIKALEARYSAEQVCLDGSHALFCSPSKKGCMLGNEDCIAVRVISCYSGVLRAACRIGRST